MTTIGYARVSTTDQDLDIQVAALKREGCTTIRSEKRSGTTTQGREELRTVLDFLRKGDVLMVTRIDRLARSIGGLQDIVRAVRAKGASLKATEQPIDTSTAAGKCFLDMLGVFAEFETNLRRERQLEGIAKAKAKGIYKGRTPSMINRRYIGAVVAAASLQQNFEICRYAIWLIGFDRFRLIPMTLTPIIEAGRGTPNENSRR